MQVTVFTLQGAHVLIKLSVCWWMVTEEGRLDNTDRC